MGYSKVCVHAIRPLALKLADGVRYYHQRYSIFSKYDEGIWMTEDAWFGVTPEPVARWVREGIFGPVNVDCFQIRSRARG